MNSSPFTEGRSAASLLGRSPFSDLPFLPALSPPPSQVFQSSDTRKRFTLTCGWDFQCTRSGQKEQCSDFLRTQPDEHPFSWFNLVLFCPSTILLIMMKILGAIAVQYCVPITRGRSHILNIFQKWPISPSCIISHYHMHHTPNTPIQHHTNGTNDSNFKPMCQWSFDTKSQKCVCHDTCLILWPGWCMQQCRPPQWRLLLCKSPSKMPKAAGWPSLVLLCV